MKLFIAEKPIVHHAINDALPNIEADGISNVHLFYKFVYDGYTFPSTPRYEHEKDCGFLYRMVHHKANNISIGGSFNFYEATFNDFLQYSEICLFIELDHSGVRCSDLFLDHFFGDMKSNYPVTFTVIENHSSEHIHSVYDSRMDFFKEPSTARDKNKHEQINYYREKYKIKDYIDFNFNGLMKQFFPTGKLLMTRNKIITLLLLEQCNFTTVTGSEAKIMKAMSKHKIGSPASTSVILSTLKDAEFVTSDTLTVTQKGKSFIESLPSVLTDFSNLMEFQIIENLKNVTHADKIALARLHLSLLFADYLN
jgi:hypothetical protein